MRGKRIAITGVAGFIGSNIAHTLCDDNEVVGIDNFATGHFENIDDIRDSIEFHNADITKLEILQTLFKDVDYVLHLGAIPSVPRSIEDPIATNEVNVKGTLNVLVAARDSDVRRVVFSSSSSIYGDTPVLPKHEEMTPSPQSPYAISKLAGEHYCRVFYNIYGLETVSLRYFNVFGPRQDPNSQYAAVIPKFIMAVSSGKKLVVFGDGEQTRDFTFVDNVVQANIMACTAKGAPGGVYNIGCGERHSINELVQDLNIIFGKDITPEYTAPRAGDVKHSLADISRARNDLDYVPKVSFSEGLKITSEYFR